MSNQSFVYVTYIRTTPEKLWAALTDSEFTKRYWLSATPESDWKPGSPWRIVFADGRVADTGEILEADPPRRLVIGKWHHRHNPELKAEGYSRCTMELEPVGGAVKLTVTHVAESQSGKLIEAVSGGWPKILSNLKSLLETGEIVSAELGAPKQAART
jgi:uncharacterized protein YndB with AHSA1/START domain